MHSICTNNIVYITVLAFKHNKGWLDKRVCMYVSGMYMQTIKCGQFNLITWSFLQSWHSSCWEGWLGYTTLKLKLVFQCCHIDGDDRGVYDLGDSQQN